MPLRRIKAKVGRITEAWWQKSAEGTRERSLSIAVCEKPIQSSHKLFSSMRLCRTNLFNARLGPCTSARKIMIACRWLILLSLGNHIRLFTSTCLWFEDHLHHKMQCPNSPSNLNYSWYHPLLPVNLKLLENAFRSLHCSALSWKRLNTSNN